MQDTKEMPVVTVASRFDLATMKRLFGEPVLFGLEKMAEFDDYAEAILQDLDPGDALMASLVYQFTVESFSRARLMRYQSRAVQAEILNGRSISHSAKQDREDEAAWALDHKINVFEKFDYLITESTKREAALLQQISFYRLALAEKLSRKLAAEERRVELRERKYNLRKQLALEHFMERRAEERALEASQRTVRSLKKGSDGI